MPRAVLLVLDSLGCGGAGDAARFGDAGADTLGHLAAACAAGAGDREGLRSGPLRLSHLGGLGLGLAAEASTGRLPPGLARPTKPGALWGYGVERAPGKDTPSGHWEIAGAPALEPWGYFPKTVPCLPAKLTAALIAEGKLPGILGNCVASGPEIIERLGAEHVRTGAPVCYTSADSVLQIAAHETAFGRERLYDLCRIARRLCNPLNIGRVIARPLPATRGTASPAPPTARILGFPRRPAIFWNGSRPRRERSCRSARLAIFSRIVLPARRSSARTIGRISMRRSMPWRSFRTAV